MKKIFALIAFLASVATVVAAPPFVNTEKSPQLLTVGVHAMVGNSGIWQNYRSCYPEINELDISAGTAFGFGASGHIHFTEFLSMGVETNFMINNYRMNLAVADDNAVSMTACYTHNHFYTFNFPVYLTTSFNLGNVVRWNVDLGLFYTYGVGGNSKTDFYRGRVNELGQFTTTVAHQKTPYYNSSATFLTSSYRGDIGLHLATGLVISRRVTVGVRCQIGLKNESNAYNATKVPSTHNYNVLATAGYLFNL